MTTDHKATTIRRFVLQTQLDENLSFLRRIDALSVVSSKLATMQRDELRKGVNARIAEIRALMSELEVAA